MNNNEPSSIISKQNSTDSKKLRVLHYYNFYLHYQIILVSFNGYCCFYFVLFCFFLLLIAYQRTWVLVNVTSQEFWLWIMNLKEILKKIWKKIWKKFENLKENKNILQWAKHIEERDAYWFTHSVIKPGITECSTRSLILIFTQIYSIFRQVIFHIILLWRLLQI